MILRRATGGGQPVRAPDAGSYAFSDWVLKAGERTLVDREGVSLPLSTGEYNLLLALVTHPRQVLTRDQLLDLTQGREAPRSTARSTTRSAAFAARWRTIPRTPI